jgi:hypothetical protein
VIFSREKKSGHKFIIVATLVNSFMSKETLIFIAGFVLIIVPFLGVPEVWRQYSVLAVGVILILIGYSLRRASYLHRLDKGDGDRGNDSYVETTETLFDDSTLK